uniref:FCH and mu domain containing endocytic adaptor 2 n=1 Tax=Oncorhynchus mykiss TaxID=8022 RepID=A0A8K9V8A3_ONCMY
NNIYYFLTNIQFTNHLFVVFLPQGEKNNGFDVLYHNMKHGQISSKELTDFIRERATIEEVYARSMTKLAKSAGNFSQLGTFAPVWDVFKTSTEKLASCHLELVRKLQELIKDVQKYVDDQAKVHKKTKEEVASTNGAVQTIQTTGVALQKSKENYNAKTVDQERLRKEGATQREVDKAGVKAKKATEAYKGLVEKYATAKSEFEQKMAETAQKFQNIEESHIVHMKDIIQSYAQSVDETHVQIGEVSHTHTHIRTFTHTHTHSCGWGGVCVLSPCSVGSLGEGEVGSERGRENVATLIVQDTASSVRPQALKLGPDMQTRTHTVYLLDQHYRQTNTHTVNILYTRTGVSCSHYFRGGTKCVRMESAI